MNTIKTLIPSQLDEDQVGFLVSMINQIYLESEADLWKEEHERTSKERLTEIVEKGELLMAVAGNEIYGCIHLEPMDENMSKFKMLVANPKHKGKGIGSILVDFAEREARKNGKIKMQLELLVPTEFQHPDKVFLNAWYTRIGYKKVAEESVDAAHEGLSKLLKTGCVAEIYQKVL